MTHMATILSWALKKDGLTQTDLAHRLGWHTPAFLNMVIRGHNSFPPKRFRRLAKVTGIPLEEIVAAHMRDKFDTTLRASGVTK